jgi:alpha-L-rhamnosidase
MAAVLDRPADAALHRSRAAVAAQQLNEKFFNRKTGIYVVPSAVGHFPLQTANLVPLQLEIAPTADRASILAQVLNDIRVTHQEHLMTGIIGTKALVEVLIREREGELLYQLATQPTYPGWGFWLANGATTHWQSWSGKDFATDQNHAMFGTIEEFLSHGIAGIVPPTDPGTTPGWRHIRIAPMILQHLDWAEATVPTPLGPVRSRWEKHGHQLVFEIDVPVGATATLEAPSAFWRRSEEGKPATTISIPLSAGLHRLNVVDGKPAFL